MSVVTSLVLVFSARDRDVVGDLVLGACTEVQRFVDVTEAANGGAVGPSRKMLPLRVAATAVNYLASVADLAARVEAASWKAPESVLLLAQREHGVRPAVWGFAGALYFGTVDEPRKFVCLIPAVLS